MRSFLAHTRWLVSTPNSRALFWAIRPRALSGNRLTQPVLSPKRATPAATVSSDPPTLIFKVEACSSLSKSGGERRTIASPKVMTSGMPSSSIASSCLRHASSLPVDEQVDVAERDGIRVGDPVGDARRDQHCLPRRECELLVPHVDLAFTFQHVVQLLFMIVSVNGKMLVGSNADEPHLQVVTTDDVLVIGMLPGDGFNGLDVDDVFHRDLPRFLPSDGYGQPSVRLCASTTQRPSAR